MRTRSRSFFNLARAFTRVDLLALLAGMGLICVIVIPSLGDSANRSERVVCLNNLGQLGRAYQMWATDHDGWLPFLADTNQGGLQRHPLGVNIYFQVAILSNELRNASVLACPSDLTTRRARDFSTAPGGLLNPLLRNNAVSYFVTHAWDGLETGALAGDRNLEGTTFASGCSIFLSTLGLEGRIAAWRDSIHMSSGNILFQNGAAEQTSNVQLRSLLIFRDVPGAGSRSDYHLIVRSQ